MSDVKTTGWVVQPAKEQNAPLPEGYYLATFQGVSDFSLPQGGELKWRWVWSVASGDDTGREATALTDMAINAKTLPGRLVAGLLGREPQVGENVKSAIDACIGKLYMVTIQGGAKGGKPAVRVVGKPPAM